MTSTTALLKRNRSFAEDFNAADLPIIPKLRTIILTCVDARVDPAHVLGLGLGDAVVIRNSGGRVTKDVIDEIGALAVMVEQMNGGQPGAFEVVIMEHTQCGAQRFADPQLQSAIKAKIGVDVSGLAITNHEEDLKADIEKLRVAPEIPGYIVVSAMLYDVATGSVRQITEPEALGDI
ncbi:Beta-carbonic anhydrase 1 [Roseibium album]|nr:Beta-carbonic anhydrase 1 [Roseibium album]